MDAMNPIEYHLKLTIYLWCGANPNQYTIQSQLRDIWNTHVPGVNYEPAGIARFMHQMYGDAVFGSCGAAQNMTQGEFISGGDLQTVNSVYVRLQACASSAAAKIATEATPPWG
ncbi:MAG TPA: hypothetical protein VN881_02275 [Candidatus Acidoferrales bacterium]|nr:hypothetical protein [Candidatus Acidoferrales bacterium]